MCKYASCYSFTFSQQTGTPSQQALEKSFYPTFQWKHRHQNIGKKEKKTSNQNYKTNRADIIAKQDILQHLEKLEVKHSVNTDSKICWCARKGTTFTMCWNAFPVELLCYLSSGIAEHHDARRCMMCALQRLLPAPQKGHDRNCSEPHRSYLKVKVLKAKCLEETRNVWWILSVRSSQQIITKKKTCPPVPCVQQHCVHLSLPWLRLQTAAVYYEQNVTDENKS